MGCAHCGHKVVSRPRGLCWVCYYTPGIRQQHRSTSKYGIWADGAGVPDAMLTPKGKHARMWLVIGTLENGDRVCLGQSRHEHIANRRRDRLAKHLDGYTAITVEREMTF